MGEALSEEPVNLYGHLDALRGDICELCNTALRTATEAAECVLEEVYEDTEYATVVKIKEDLTATVTQYANLEHDDYTRRWDLSKWEVCTHLEPVFVGMLEDLVAKAKRVLDVARDSRPGSPNTTEILGLLQLTYDKGLHVLSSFKQWENNHAEPLALFVESFRDYLLFLAERIVLRLEELAAGLRAIWAEEMVPAGIGQEQTSEMEESGRKVSKGVPYVEIDMAARTLTVGEKTITPTDKVWEFLKELIDAKRHNLPDLKPREWKNAADMLRRKTGRENLQFVLGSTKYGYRLAPGVKLKGGGQVGIRKTK